MITYSVIIPIYNEEENLPELYNRLVQVINPCSRTSVCSIKGDNR